MQKWKLHHSTNPHYHLKAEYPCTPNLFGVNIFTVLSYRWTKCPFKEVDPTNACGRVDPAPFDGRYHVALVPTCVSGLSRGCSLEEKAKNLGQANYVAFITWNDYNCSSGVYLPTVSSTGVMAVPIVVTEDYGRKLLLSAGNPDFAVDVYVAYNNAFALAGFVVALCLLFCLCCCLIYCSARLCCLSARRRRNTTSRQRHSLSRRALNRMAVKCTYKIGQGMNETCSICLEEFTEGEQVRELPCLHVYHGGCVEKWLKEYKHTCPLCKTPITAETKKRVAANSSDVAPLMLVADEETSISDGSFDEDDEEETVETLIT